MGLFYLAPSVNYKQTTLNGNIDSAVQTITLNSTTNMTYPGYVIIDRQDSAGNNTPTAREVVSYTGISGSNLTGCTRGADNSSALSHNNGALVETMPTVGMWNSLVSAIQTFTDPNGYISAINSPVSIAIGQFKTEAISSIASIAELHVTSFDVATRFDASGASVTGNFGGLINPTWYMPGIPSSASVGIGRPLAVPKDGTFNFVNVTLNANISTPTGFFDVKKNSVSIFDAANRPLITGGTFVSTASIKTRTFIAGDVFSVDYAGVGGNNVDATLTASAN
jgi:hypothetical protein